MLIGVDWLAGTDGDAFDPVGGEGSFAYDSAADVECCVDISLNVY